jgi:hypothetical protein
MSVSRRSFIKAMAAASGTALMPIAEAVPRRNLSASEAIRYLCNGVFASSADRASRMAMREWHSMEKSHGR